MTDRSHPFKHEHYEELCALATAGALTAAESEELFAHLNECTECSRCFAEYQSLAGEAMPMLGELHRTIPEADEFNESVALEHLLQVAKRSESLKPMSLLRSNRPYSHPGWRAMIAAGLLISVALGFYKLGSSHHGNVAAQSSTTTSPHPNVEQELQDLRTSLQDAKRKEEALQVRATQEEADLDRAHEDATAAQARLEAESVSEASNVADSVSKLRAITDERNAAMVKVQDAELMAKNAQDELNSLRFQRKQDETKIATLESQIGGLNVALNLQNSRAKDDEQFLISDKDIRDLIGARNLYIADIMDVRQDGSSKKPFGRVFYTKTKSLIFYAYDLDKQPGVKTASTFHVWGRSGPDDRKPLNLGVLYLDSETNRRWTLRVDNPEQLARLDAVFVTVEQGEQPDKPTGKPFLYASLRREPNHP